ncbi:MAG: hypothetical protein ABMB14_28455 [Myxococcota bacterium]
MSRLEPAYDEQQIAETWARIEAALDLGRACRMLAEAPATHRRTLEALVLEDRSIDEATGGDRGQARDALYKRRARATAWMRNRRDGGPIAAGGPSSTTWSHR